MKNMITQAFIFAAGRGSRMRPLTDSIPKPLVKVKNKSIIDYTIEKLNTISSLQKIIINGFYLQEKLHHHLINLNNPKIIFSQESEKLETGGGLIFAQNHINFNEPLLLINGDLLWQEQQNNSDLVMMIKTWHSTDCDILLGLKKKGEYLGYECNEFGGGDFNLDSTGKLTKIPLSSMSHAFVGIQIINPKILKRPFVSNFERCFSMSQFYKQATDENGNVNNIKGLELPGKYFHIGTVDAIKNTEDNMLISSY